MKAMSLKIQIASLVIVLVACLVAAFSLTVATNEKRMLLSEVLRRAVLQGRNLALSSAKPLLHEDPEFELHPLVTRVLAAEKDIVSLVVVDRSGVIKGHRDVLSIDRAYESTPCLGAVAGAGFALPGEEIRENDRLIEVKVPVTDQSELIGYVYLQYSKEGVHAAIAAIRGRMIRIGVIALIAGAFSSLLLALHIARPVRALIKGAEAIGHDRFDTRIDVRSVKELQTLARAFNGMAKRLEDNRKALIEQERIGRELEIAHDIQETFLPTRLPRLANYEVEAYYHAATEVGGDYFDLIPLDEERLLIVVGDVAGKGVPGLVVMAMTRILVRALAQNDRRPADLLRRLNVLLHEDMNCKFFVTLFCGLLDMRSGNLIISNAGHMPLIVYSGAERALTTVGTKTKPVGIFPDKVFSRDIEDRLITLKPGDCIVQFTDGLSEMRNEAGEEYGLERLMQVTSREAARGSRHLVHELLKSLAAFRGTTPQSDDLTIVALSAMPAGVARAPREQAERLEGVPSQ
jgi:serine phosphatase RsbU (regulator of sigma subunit)